MSTPDYTAAFQIIASAINLRADQLSALDIALGVPPPGPDPAAAKQAAIQKATDEKASADARLQTAQSAESRDEAEIAAATADQAAAIKALADAQALPDVAPAAV
jgi:hypothetical protein